MVIPLATSLLLAFQLQAIQVWALHAELLDPRECRYLLARPGELASDLLTLDCRRLDLAAAPNTWDVRRFPPREEVERALGFNRAYRQLLVARQAVAPRYLWWEYQGAINETDRLYHVWDVLRDAGCDYYYVTIRRRALVELRRVLGAQAFYEGRLPCPVPWWRFEEVR